MKSTFRLLLLAFSVFTSTNSLRAQWVQTNGPYGGTVSSLAINSNGDIFAGTAGSGVFRSTDNGNSWTQINSGFINSKVSSLAINSNGDIFAGTAGSGVFRSIDNGNNWTQINSGFINSTIYSLAINSNGDIYAGNGAGLFRSTNNGNNWTNIKPVIAYSITINSNRDIFVGCTNGVFRSTDNGSNWTEIDFSLPTNILINCFAINNSGNVFAGGLGSFDYPGGVFRSTTNGNSWTRITNGLTSSYVYSIAINSAGYIFAGTGDGKGIFRSTDNGNNWTQINNGLTASNVYSLAISNGGNIFAGFYGIGVFHSTNNGDNWAEINNGLISSNVYSLAINSQRVVFVGSGSGVFRSTTNGNSWTRITNGLTSSYVYSIAINSAGYIFAGTGDGKGIFRSTDNGNNWTQINNGLTASNVYSLAISNGGNIFAGFYGIGVFHSTNNGDNWAKINNYTEGSGNLSLAINSSGDIYAGSGGGLYRSTDDGNNWSLIISGYTTGAILSIAINSSGDLFAGTLGGGVFRSTDNGNNWTQINNGLTNSKVCAFAINSSGDIFAGTDGGGVFRTTDNGNNWTQIIGGLTNSNISSLAINNSSGDIYAGTNGSGVWRLPMEMISTVIIKAPTINISRSVISNIENLQVTGSNYTPTGSVNLNISGPSGIAIPKVTITADANGKIVYTFTANMNMQPGYYYVVGTDVTTNKTTSVQKFQIINEPNNYKLTLNFPKQGSQYYSGDNLNVAWADQMVLSSNYIIDGAKRRYNYKIELSTDGGSTWINEATLTGKEEVNKVVSFSKDILLTMAGSNNKIRVTDLYNISSNIISGSFTVKAPPSADIKTSLEWDYSFPERIWNPIGVACDGVARIYLRVFNANTASTDNITGVTVTLSDADNNTEARILGKLQIATITDTYSEEANNAYLLTVTNNKPASDGAFWFWYVSPDDFCGNNVQDTTESIRTVDANITIAYSSGKIDPPYIKTIKIVRPPLLLAHGLASSPSTWDNFPYKENDGYTIHDRKFVNDKRFIVNKALTLFPGGSFKSNAERLLNHSDGASFYYNINDMRSWYKYASNQVIYIGHSMGGDVVREAINMGVSEQENYYKGYLNRVITIDSPHRGSPAADLIFYLLKSNLIDMVGRYFLNNDQNYNSLLHSLIDYKGLISVSATGALEDLRIKREEIFNQTDVPFHLIAGDVVVGQSISDAEKAFVQQKAGDYFNFIDKISDDYTKLSFLTPEDFHNINLIMKIENTTTRVIRFYKYILGLFESNYADGNDMIVSLNSQISSLQSSSKNTSIFPGVDHQSVLNNYSVGNRVNTLVNGRKQDYYGSVPEIIPPLNKISAKLFKASKLNVSRSVANNNITINSINNNDIVPVDSVFNVSFNISDTTNLAYVKVYFQNESYLSSQISYQYNFVIQANGNYLDSQRVEVVASFITQDSSYLLNDYRNILVTTNSQPNSFRVSDKTVYIMKNQLYNPNYTAVFPTFISQINSNSPNLSVSVDNTQIVKYDNQNKIFKSLTAGETSAIITYKGVADTVYFDVDTTDYNSILVGVDNSNNKIIVPTEYILEQNYPNPFNPTTTIKYSIPHASKIKIQIYDILGREVATVINEMKSAGTYTATFNAANMSSGVYFYRLQAGSFTETKKLLLLR